ncbi:unnamed protein product, partial [Mesorhabditis spiculigera]
MLRRDGSILAGIIFFSVGAYGKAIDIFDMTSLEPIEPNYCNNSEILEQAGLYKSTLGQFLGFECSQEFYHCRWQSDGFRTYRKACKTGLVYDTFGTQNCNYDYNVKGCQISSGDSACNTTTSFWCPLSEQCVELHKRCDGTYDCSLEEDEQNCPLCAAGELACVVSEECVPIDRRCNGISECSDGTDERDCDVCGHGLFHCGKSNECVPLEHRCDGQRDCRHGEDEMLCRNKPVEKSVYTCENRRETIPMQNVCDNEINCSDGSDEKYCEVAGQPPTSVILSSNPRPEAPPQPVIPQIISAPQELPQPEAPEQVYEEYENPEDEKADYQAEKAAFPMISIPVLPPAPPPKIVQKKITPMKAATRAPPPPPPPTTERPTPAVFSRPRPRPQPRIKIQNPAPAVPKAIFVQPTFVEVTAPPAPQEKSIEYSTEEETTVIVKTKPTRRPLGVKNGKRTKIPKGRTTTASPVGVPKSQEVAQVSRMPPQMKNPPLGQRYSVAPMEKVTRVTAPPEEYGETTAGSPHKLIQQISTHLARNGRSDVTADLLTKIEAMLTTQLGPEPTTMTTTRGKKLSRRPTKFAPTSNGQTTIQRFVSRVTRPARTFEVSQSMFN